MTETTPTLNLDRRAVLASGAAGAGLAGVSAISTSPAVAARIRYFRHGVASGDPKPKAVVIWTRVTPTKQARPGSGKGPKANVRWEVATDRRFRKVVRQGTFTTSASRDHTVKVDVRRLKPDTWYYYRFIYRGATSRTGRTRTAPNTQASPANVRFGMVSCANLQAGWFAAYRHLGRRNDLNAIVHLGDYLYEYAPGEYGLGQSNIDVRKHRPAREMVSISDYRIRHSQYKRDKDLQYLHARYPFIVTWDDHETTNDAWRRGAENHNDGEGDYLRRRGRAYRAYDEWMPLRMNNTAKLGDGTRLFRRLRFGKLLELSMLDLRTYRSEQVETTFPTPVPAPESEVSDKSRTITGEAQYKWLRSSLTRKRIQWKIIGNPVMIAPVTFAQVPSDLLDPINDVTGLLPDDGLPYNVDQWDGYTHDRRRIFRTIRDRQVKDVVFITGDIHSGWACDLPYDVATYPLESGSAGVEFVCSSITSNNLKDITGTPRRTTSVAVEQTILTNNRHIKYLNFDDHGYSVLDVTPERAQVDWFVIGDRNDPKTGVRYETSFLTRSGTGVVTRTSQRIK